MQRCKICKTTGMTNAEVLHQVEHGYRMASPQNCPPALYDIMLECWHKVFSIIQRSSSIYPHFANLMIYSPRNFSMLRNLTGCNETAYFWDPAVEVGRLFHDVGLGVQGRLRLLTCASAPGHHFVSFLAYCIAVSTLLYQSYVHTVTSVS